MADYAFATAYLKGEEARLVSANLVEALMRTTDVAESLTIISLTDIGAFLGDFPPRTFGELDERLWLYLGGCLEQIRGLAPVPAEIHRMIDAYEVKYDVANIKAALRRIATGERSRQIPMGRLHRSGLLEELSRAQEMADIVQVLGASNLDDYAAIVLGYKVGMTAQARLRLEGRLDNRFHRDLLNAVRRLADGEAMAQAIGVMIDMANLKLVFRAVAQGMGPKVADFALDGGHLMTHDRVTELLTAELPGIPGRVPYLYQAASREIAESYVRTRDIAVVDAVADRHELILLRDLLSLRLMSPAVALWYLILKEYEIRNLRLILKAMFDGRSPQEVKDYLVVPPWPL